MVTVAVMPVIAGCVTWGGGTRDQPTSRAQLAGVEKLLVADRVIHVWMSDFDGPSEQMVVFGQKFKSDRGWVTFEFELITTRDETAVLRSHEIIGSCIPPWHLFPRHHYDFIAVGPYVTETQDTPPSSPTVSN